MTDFASLLFPTITDSQGSPSTRLTVHGAIRFVLIVLLAAAQPVSNWLMSAAEIMLAVNWALEWDMKRKFKAKDTMPLLIAFAALYAIHAVWMIGSDNIDYGMSDLLKKLPLLAIPLVLLTSHPLNRQQVSVVFFCYVGTVAAAMGVGWYRYLTIDNLPYRDIVPYISHIRFALNVCFSIVLLVYYTVVLINKAHDRGEHANAVEVIILIAVILSMMLFIAILQSYTSFIILTIVAVVMLVCYGRRIKPRRTRIAMVAVVAAAIATVAALSAVYCHDYYKPSELTLQPIVQYTANGNRYVHQHDGLIENGGYINDYVCAEELKKEWASVSLTDIETTTSTGYTVYPTLIRYLNAKGLTKDSLGVHQLTPHDIELIESGIANPAYATGNPLRKMVCIMLFELENRKCSNAVVGFSMLQRIELWRNGWAVFLSHPVLGTGSDIQDICQKRLVDTGSPLANSGKHIHNQYLSILVEFGIVGFLVIVALFLWAFRRLHIRHLPLVVAYLCIVLISFISEDTLETLAGVVFSSFFLCFICTNKKTIEDIPNN